MGPQAIAEIAQKRVLEAIPPRWRLAGAKVDKFSNANVIDIPRTCGLLTERQLQISEQTAVQLLGQLATGQLSSVEVTEAFCARAAVAHQLTNCLTAYFSGEALASAAALDATLKETGKPVGPLHGLPVAIKDMYDLKGHCVTLGFISWSDVIADEDSTLVAMLRKAGAVFYVKTTMPQTGMALETSSALWGTTVNPFNSSLASGGSSGGDAVLVAMRGCPITPSSDIGGSIRVPAAFNGLYSIRPSAERIPKSGMRTTVIGQASIKTSCGPVCHSVADLKMFTELINAHPHAKYDPSSIPVPWRSVIAPTRKLSFGYFDFDGVCMPHPPVRRAVLETVEKLKAAGHEVFKLDFPFDCWELAVTTWKLYFQTGAAEHKATIAKGGESILPSLKSHLEIYDIKALTTPELYKLHKSQGGYKALMSKHWSKTALTTCTGLPMDAIICPVHPSTSFPHDFPCWWGYSSMFNILDYPSTTIPVKGFKVSAETDPKDLSYQPLDNAFDKATYDIYYPSLFASQPMCIQIVGRPYEDEELLEITDIVDSITNPSL